MKALLVVGSDKAFQLVSFYVRPLGFEIIRYRQPIKAMDNLDEVDPDAVIVSAEDFPRHWKTIVQFVRSERSKDRTVVILVKGPNFPYDEAAKAAHIGVNGIVTENLDDLEELERFQQILGRYKEISDSRETLRLRPEDWDRLEFLFTNPSSGAIVTGKIESFSKTGLSFRPDRPVLIEGINRGDILEDCSLRVGDAILSPQCTVMRTDRVLELSFGSFAEGDSHRMEEYIRSRPLRARRSASAVSSASQGHPEEGKAI